jgi:transposase
MAARDEFDKRLDEELFRTLLANTHRHILARICSKAEELAERQGREPSSVIADWTGIGTIAAAAIYRVYKREQPAEI